MSRLTPFGRFFTFLQPYRNRMAASALLVMGAAGINLAMLWVVRRLVDTVLVQRDPAALNAAILAAAVPSSACDRRSESRWQIRMFQMP